MTRHAVLASMVVSVLAGLGACESGGGRDGSAAPVRLAPAPSATSELSPDDIPVAREWMERPELPLDGYGDLANRAQETDSAIANRDGGVWEVKQEEFIAACMKQAGFIYYPREVKPLAAGESSTGLTPAGRRLWVPWLPDDLVDAERYGYSYSKPIEVIGNTPVADPSVRDPNEEYVASLSAPARK